MAATAAARRHVFQSVFHRPKHDTSAPTPQLGSAPFGGAPSFSETVPSTDTQDSATEKIQWERAWHSATTFLALPDVPISANNDGEAGEAILRARRPCSAGVTNAIRYLISEHSLGRRLREKNKEDNLLAWYSQEILRHYLQFQVPQLLDV